MVATLTPKIPGPIAIGPESVSGNRNHHKIRCLLCASDFGARVAEEFPWQLVAKPGERKSPDFPQISAFVGNAIAKRHKVVIFGTVDRAEGARRLARLYFRIWPGLPIDVEWLEPQGSAMPEACR